MIDHVWTIVCSRSVIDRDSNNLSLFNVLEQVTVQRRPAPGETVTIPIGMEVVTLWSRSDYSEPARGVERLTLISPSADVLASGEQAIDLSDHRRFRNRARFQGFPVKGEGRYVFRVEWKSQDEQEWHHVTDVPLELIIEAEEAVPQKSP